MKKLMGFMIVVTMIFGIFFGSYSNTDAKKKKGYWIGTESAQDSSIKYTSKKAFKVKGKWYNMNTHKFVTYKKVKTFKRAKKVRVGSELSDSGKIIYNKKLHKGEMVGGIVTKVHINKNGQIDKIVYSVGGIY